MYKLGSRNQQFERKYSGVDISLARYNKSMGQIYNKLVASPNHAREIFYSYVNMKIWSKFIVKFRKTSIGIL